MSCIDCSTINTRGVYSYSVSYLCILKLKSMIRLIEYHDTYEINFYLKLDVAINLSLCQINLSYVCFLYMYTNRNNACHTLKIKLKFSKLTTKKYHKLYFHSISWVCLIMFYFIAFILSYFTLINQSILFSIQNCINRNRTWYQ